MGLIALRSQGSPWFHLLLADTFLLFLFVVFRFALSLGFVGFLFGFVLGPFLVSPPFLGPPVALFCLFGSSEFRFAFLLFGVFLFGFAFLGPLGSFLDSLLLLYAGFMRIIFQYIHSVHIDPYFLASYSEG